MNSIESVVSHIQQNRDEYLKRLFDLLRIPSESAVSERAEDCNKAADWIFRQFQQMGVEAQLVETESKPIVLAQTPKVDDAPTVLVYGHYDVQPAVPLEKWDSPPYEPEIRDGNIYARGATDDKGQMLTHVFSAEAWMKTNGQPPVNLKFLIEGEEEVGSKALAQLLEGKYDDQLGCPVDEKLACDVIAISDNTQFAPGQPAITYGLRGIVALELEFFGPSQDLHSGAFGGAVTNPVNALTSVIGSMKTADGEIQIEGFFDGIQELSPTERENWNRLGFRDEDLMEQIQVDGLTGENGYSTLERQWARPTLDFNGIYGGYQGEGSKTIIPSSAGVKITSRLVAGQDPDHVIAMIRKHIEDRIPAGIRWNLHVGHGAPAMAAATDSPFMKGASKAITEAFGTEPVLIRSGGSIPIVSTFKQKLKVDTLLLGWGQNDDNLHSPNEKFSAEDFFKGTLASAHFWGKIAES